MSATTMEPVVADLALARRLERAEGRSNAEFVAARAKAYPKRGAEWIEAAGALAMFDGVGSPCTQTFGLGLFDAVGGAQLDAIERFFQRHGADVCHEICPLVDISLMQMLHDRGYRPIEVSSVMFRSISATASQDPPHAGPVTARVATRDEAGLWSQTAAAGWADVVPHLGDFLLELEMIYPHLPNSRHFLAECRGEVVAVGGLALFEGIALLAGACTVPKWRKQGAQKALLEYRLRYAAERGFDTAMIVAAPGSSSQRNAERQGFRIAYTRTKWCLAAPKA